MKDTNKVAKAFILVLQIGITMIVSIALCGGVGYYIDHRFGTSLMVFFIALGVISGYRGVYSLIMQFIDFGSSDDKYQDMFEAWDEQGSECEGDDEDDEVD